MGNMRLKAKGDRNDNQSDNKYRQKFNSINSDGSDTYGWLHLRIFS